MLIEELDRDDINTEILEDLKFHGDLIATEVEHMRPPNDYIEFLQEYIQWETLSPYRVPRASFLRETLKAMWHPTHRDNPFFGIKFIHKVPPKKLYRYMAFNQERIEKLLEGDLFLPCPAWFNDPFDSSLDEEIRLTFIESAMGCFSIEDDNILLYSHYADNHRGICVGFNTNLLIETLTNSNKNLKADLRPVWYFSKMPPFNIKTHTALCATSKHDVWSYENEYRLFMVDTNDHLAPSGTYKFDSEAITDVICGCKSSDDTIRACKTLSKKLDSCERKVAQRKPSKFGVHLYTIIDK
ncbi:MAG: DUF2971 domain-containing protein [Candidatus Thiodiazotropha sp. L084R]